VELHLGWLDSAAAGLLQGVASVFPMGGYGHAVIISALAGDSAAGIDPSKASYLYACLHIAIAVGLFAYFWRDWLHVVRGIASSLLHRRGEPGGQRSAWLTLVACVPGCIGVIELAHLARPLQNHPRVVAALLAANGVLLIAVWLWWRRSPRAAGLSGTHRAPMTRREEAEAVSSELSYLRWGQALIVGCMPISLVVPGASATGLALAVGLLRRMSHEQAVRFGLLVYTPAMFAWGVLDFPSSSALSPVAGAVVLGSVVAAVAAYLTAALLVRYFKGATLRPFGLYALLAGGAAYYGLVHMA